MGRAGRTPCARSRADWPGRRSRSRSRRWVRVIGLDNIAQQAGSEKQIGRHAAPTRVMQVASFRAPQQRVLAFRTQFVEGDPVGLSRFLVHRPQSALPGFLHPWQLGEPIAIAGVGVQLAVPQRRHRDGRTVGRLRDDARPDGAQRHPFFFSEVSRLVRNPHARVDRPARRVVPRMRTARSTRWRTCAGIIACCTNGRRRP